jgi:hypothetical protein
VDREPTIASCVGRPCQKRAWIELRLAADGLHGKSHGGEGGGCVWRALIPALTQAKTARGKEGIDKEKKPQTERRIKGEGDGIKRPQGTEEERIGHPADE